MSLLDYFRGRPKNTASIAKERLQIIIAHERGQHRDDQAPDYLESLQAEIVAVIAKYVKIDRNQVKVGLEKSGESTVLEVNIPLQNEN